MRPPQPRKTPQSGAPDPTSDCMTDATTALTLTDLLDGNRSAPLRNAAASGTFCRSCAKKDYGRPEALTLAATFMAQLGASRNGLTENELADLLALPGDPLSEATGKPRLPQVYLSRLLNAFKPFLLNKQGNRAPMHRNLWRGGAGFLRCSPGARILVRLFQVGIRPWRGYVRAERSRRGALSDHTTCEPAARPPDRCQKAVGRRPGDAVG